MSKEVSFIRMNGMSKQKQDFPPIIFSNLVTYKSALSRHMKPANSCITGLCNTVEGKCYLPISSYHIVIAGRQPCLASVAVIDRRDKECRLYLPGKRMAKVMPGFKRAYDRAKTLIFFYASV